MSSHMQLEVPVGYYVNPNDRSKDVFLMSNGVAVPGRTLDWADVPNGSLPVVHIDNGIFTSAGIAYCEAELKEFTRSDDRRPRTIYIVPINKLLEVSGDDFRRWWEKQKENVTS